MFSKAGDLLPIIFLITDGAVEDEKEICDAMKGHLKKGGMTTPRICTFGIGEVFVIHYSFPSLCFWFIAFDVMVLYFCNQLLDI